MSHLWFWAFYLYIYTYIYELYLSWTLRHQRAFTCLVSMKPEDAKVRELQRASKGTTTFLCMLTMKKFTMSDSRFFKHLQAPKSFKGAGAGGTPIKTIRKD